MHEMGGNIMTDMRYGNSDVKYWKMDIRNDELGSQWISRAHCI
jgi:hypothetical protein